MSANEELLPDFLAECADILEKMNSALDRLPAAPNRSELLDSVFRGIHTIKGSCGMFGFENSKSLAHELESRIAEFKAKPETLGPRDIAEIREKTSRIENLLKSRDRISNDSSVSPAPEPGAEFIRVSVARVNELLSGISEIFLIRNQMLYLFERWKGSSQEHRDFRQSWDLLDSAMRRGIGELERTAMGMRMTPVQGLFARLARAVESYQSQETGKKIRLITEGETTELDKKVLDTLGEPLIHLIRNAMDHGIETTADRAARHKSEQGVIRLSATIAGNEAVVEIEDDGKGIDPKKLVAVAASRGLDVSKVTDEQSAIDLIYLPGFSTAEKVSDVSGRGVGMDAVKTSVTSLGGRIQTTTRLGLGSKFTIRIPVSMSLVPALLINVNGLKYAIPNHDIFDTRQIPADQIHKNGGRQYMAYRDSFIPCLDLREALPARSDNHEELVRECSIITFRRDSRLFGARVSTLEKNTEIVVKPLSSLAQSAPYITGVAVLPTGEPVFVLSLARIPELKAFEGVTYANASQAA